MRPPDRLGDGRRRPPAAGKPSEPGRLEEVKVVTRSPLVNQRRDHYKGERGRRARQALLFSFHSPWPQAARPLLCRSVVTPESFGAPPARGGPPAQPPATDLLAPASMKNAATCDTWCELQGPSEPSSLRTHIAPAGNPAGPPVRAPPQTDHRPARAALAPAADPPVRRGAPKCIWRAARARGRVPRPAARPPGASEPSPPGTHAGRSIRLRRDRPARRTAGGMRFWGAARTRACKRRPRIGRGYPLNLSISVSGGKETNRDCPSSGERSGNSPDLKSGPPPRGGGPELQPGEGAARPPRAGPLEARRPSPLERGAAEGESPVRPRAAGPDRRRGARPSTSRVAWECCPKREVNSFQG